MNDPFPLFLAWAGVVCIPIFGCLSLFTHYDSKAVALHGVEDSDEERWGFEDLASFWGKAGWTLVAGWLAVLFVICVRYLVQA